MSNFFNFNIFLSLKIVFILANIADSDEVPHYAAFHLGLHCLPKYCLPVGLHQTIYYNVSRGQNYNFVLMTSFICHDAINPFHSDGFSLTY